MPVQRLLDLHLDAAMVPVHYHQNHECIFLFNIQATCFDISLTVTSCDLYYPNYICIHPTVTSSLPDQKEYSPSLILEDQQPT